MNSSRFAVAVVMFAGCQSSDDRVVEPAPDAEAPPLAVGGERTVSVQAGELAGFVASDGALTAGHLTHGASLRDGVVSVTPYSFDTGARRPHAPLAIETAAITFDGGLVDSTLLATRVEAGVAVLDRGVVQEEIANAPEGIEQRWRFDQAPRYAGDLIVEVAATGHAYVATTDGGVHFRAPDGAGLRYSHATWIDARGREFPIRAEYAAGRIRMTVSDEVLADSEFPALLDPTVTAEQILDNAIIATTGANAQSPAIAFDGTNFLVVWSDNRSSQDDDIFGTRVSQAGTILDPAGIRIERKAGKQLHPTVAFNGTAYVVAWEDFKVPNGVEADIRATTVTTTGLVALPVTIANTAANEITPKAAGRGGGSALVVWNAAGDIRGSVVTGGSFGAAVNIAATAASETDPAVAASPGGEFLVAWSEGAAATADLRAQRVTGAGAPSGAAFTVSASNGAQLNPAATFDGTNFAVVWTNNNAGVDIFGTRISTAGAVLDTRVEATVTVGGIAVSTAANNQEVSSISCVGGGCLVAWQDRRNLTTTGFDLLGQLLTSSFTPNGGEFTLSAANLNQFAPAVTATATGYFASWFDTRSGNASNIFGATVSTAAAVGTQRNLVTGSNSETSPSIGRAASIFGVFFSDSRNDSDIAVIRFNANGSKLDNLSKSISNGTFAQFNPAASTDLGGNYYVVWSDTRDGVTKDIFGSRVNTAGTTLDPVGTPISTAAANQLIPDIASSGTVALVVWQDGRNGLTDVFGALVSSAGAVAVPDIAISTAAGNQTAPAVVFDAATNQFIVVWSDARSGVNQIFGARVSTAGVVLDANGVAISTSIVGAFTPAITTTATSSYVVWDDRRNATRDIFGARIKGGATLTVLDVNGVAVSNAAGNQTLPRIAAIGSSYLAVWTDDRAGNLDVMGQQISLAGALSGVNFVVSGAPEDESAPAITASTVAGNARIAYQKQRLDLDTVRVVTRAISEANPTGQTCANDGQCASGFCRDGKCCNSTCGGPSNLTDCQACSASKTGAADGLCAPIAAGTVCRNFAPGQSFCDVREQCNGVDLACPADVGRNQGLVCNETTGAVCPSNAPPGPHVCPS